VPNRLAQQSSPYLLQHAGNPVDWYPWGQEAFDAAARLDRPIFLSIGYSTCHWCHVMAHESFESDEIAGILNEHFVSIKLDREERPDVDRVYMTFVQATTGSGGWPMSVWLTPDLKPFYGGTYFPPDARWGKPGFPDILREIVRVWKEEHAKVHASAANLTEQIKGMRVIPPGDAFPGPETLTEGVAQFARAFDKERGGFGDAPKFPRPSELLFLMRETARTGDFAPALMVAKTVQSMAFGGMRDHVGGGFHRYSVDGEWRVPHFEKMLYDQAQITLACLEVHQLAGDVFFADVAEDTLQYVQREMTSPDGGFYSAEDADSLPPDSAGKSGTAPFSPGAVPLFPQHKMEGAYYLWTEAEIDQLLGDEAAIVKLRFGVRPNGNAPQDPQGEFIGKNILYIAKSLDDVAGTVGRARGEVEDSLRRSRLTLFEARLKRPRPQLDDKVLTAWNGLMMAAFARAARVLPTAEARDRHLETAVRSASFLKNVLWDDRRAVMRRRYRNGDAGIDGYSEDYAYLIFGLLEVFQAGGDPQWLEWAHVLQRRMDDLFWDRDRGGWFNTTGEDRTVILRLKEDYDGAEPAPSSISVLNLLTLAQLTDDPSLHDRIEKTLKMFGGRLGQLGRAVPMMLAALSVYHASRSQIVVVGPRQASQALLQELAAKYLPFAVVVPVEPGPRQAALAQALPFIGPMAMRGGPTAYVCRNFTCGEPVTDAASLRSQLE
jgi:uncharacterized protein YyaL (SSP411 family)